MPTRSRGFTLIEVVLALTLAAIIGLAATRMLTAQLRFADRQSAANNAREVSRAAINMLATDIRMVDADSGVVAATHDSFTVVTPFAEGLICGPSSDSLGTVLSLLPYDSAAYAEGGYAGYAYIDTTTTGTGFRQVYQYQYTTTIPVTTDSATAASNPPCKTATDAVALFRPGAITVYPRIPDRSRYQAAMLVRRVTYSFGPSVSIAGTRALFRRVVSGTHGLEEIVAPFDTSAKFTYYLKDGTQAASVSGPQLTSVRGIQLQLDGVSERVIPGTRGPQRAPLSTAVFFKNRPLQ